MLQPILTARRRTLAGDLAFGVLMLVSEVLGWVSLLADAAFPSVLVPIRPVRFVFAGSFCLVSVAWR